MKPILFNTAMVRAIIDGDKTVTRRVVKPQPANPRINNIGWLGWDDGHGYKMRQSYRPGDILYVRETWSEYNGVYIYKTRCRNKKILEEVGNVKIPWRPSIHMPKEAARLFLRVTDVRVERLQEITPEQVDAEGCKEWAYSAQTGELLPSSPTLFEILWDSTIKKADLPLYGWAANPWVWVIEFEEIKKEAVV